MYKMRGTVASEGGMYLSRGCLCIGEQIGVSALGSETDLGGGGGHGL